MKKVEGALKYYNANTRDANVGDCVKRSLTIAYSMDYDKVSSELNKIKKEVGAGAYNWSPVYDKFLERRGDKLQTLNEVMTVDEFCQAHPTGVWIITCGDKSPILKGAHSSHMAAIVNGDVYDSWDSRDHFVFKYTPVSTGKLDEYEMDVDDIHEELTEYLKDYAAKLSLKCPEAMRPIRVVESYDKDNRYTYEQLIRVKLGTLPGGKASWVLPWGWHPGKNLVHVLTIKMNPRLSVEENLESLKKKCKQKIYDWAYEIRRHLLEAEKMDKIKRHPKFRGDYALLMRLPDWAIPLVTGAEDSEGSDFYHFVVDMDAFPEDPRYEESSEVTFYADTISELKSQLEDYRKNYARYGYDY